VDAVKSDTRDVLALLRRVPYLGQVGLLATVYIVAAKLALWLAIPPGYATVLWPSSGIALAATLLLGNRIWPGIWIGAAMVNLMVKSSLFAAVLIASGNTLEALAAAALVQRFIGMPYAFERGEHVVKFVGYAVVSAAIPASIAVASLAFEGSMPWSDVLPNWRTWWQGDASGIIIVTPLILSWSIRDTAVWPPQKKIEGICFGLLLLIATGLVFSNRAEHLSAFPLTFVILPFIIWAAFRFSQRQVTAAIAAVCAIAVWYTIDDLDQFALPSANETLLVLLAFISVIATTGLVLNAVVGERSRAMEELGKALRDLQEQAITDPLTSLLNRRYLREFLPREVIRAARKGASLAVIMIDLDYFKRVNDAFGHEAGDLVLMEVAALLKTHIRGSDIACRYGGEEFALILADTTLENAQRRAEDIRAAIKRLDLKYRDRPLGKITASLGVALFPDQAKSADSLMRASDDALYQAKGAGRDRVVVRTAR
jgi:diguanylate cyclase (GGDEF)-like protein